MNKTSNVKLGFLVKHPGVLSLLQDAGRYGSYNLGLTNGGPIDKTAFYWANKLVGNDFSSCVIEVSIGGLVLIAQQDLVVAITGAPMPIAVNGKAQALWQSMQLKAGDTLTFGYAQQGVRCYLAVAGGFNIKQSFGSCATVCRENVGGINGNKLAANDVLPCISKQTSRHFQLSEKHRPNYTQQAVLRTVPGYQQSHFSSHQQRLFFSSEYTVTQHSDRMGYRLEGKAIKSDIDGILSEGICHGAAQIPSDGQPIVLLNDRQTIGGYPKIGAVISLDTDNLGQLAPGGKVHFEAISMEKAHNLLHLQQSLLKRTELIRCD